MGTIESPEFVLGSGWVNLYVSGGDIQDNTYVSLIDSETGNEIERFYGHRDNKMELHRCYAGKHHGKKSHIRLVDYAQGGWGKINFGGIFEDVEIARER